MHGEKWRRLYIRFRGKLLACILLAAAAGLMRAFCIPCPILHFLGIPCPGCGMTRALLSALRLDFGAAFSHHAMFWSVPLLVAFFFADGRLFPRKWMNAALLSALAAGFIAQWIGRLTAL